MYFREINLNGISNINPVDGTNQWYWGTDYIHGDLYEAEELYKMGHEVKNNRLVFIKYPEGVVYEPVKLQKGQYFGNVVFDNNQLYILYVDFEQEKIYILSFRENESTHVVAELPLWQIVDCYNLMLGISPLYLSRNGHEGNIQIIWPETASFKALDKETVIDRDGDEMISSIWFEDPDYREESIIRKYPTGEIIERFSGIIMKMIDGERWIIK